MKIFKKMLSVLVGFLGYITSVFGFLFDAVADNDAPHKKTGVEKMDDEWNDPAGPNHYYDWDD